MTTAVVAKPTPWDSPGHCVLSGVTTDNLGFLHPPTKLPGRFGDITIHLSVSALRKEVAQRPTLLAPGLSSRINTLEAKVKQLEYDLADARHKVAKAEQFQTSLAGVAREGYVIQRAPGRPRKAA